MVLELPAEVLAVAAERSAAARVACPAPARWVRPERFHVTVAFLQKDAPLEPVAEQLDPLHHALSPVPLALHGAGLFETRRAAAVLWLGVGDPVGALRALAQRVGQALRPHLAAEEHARDGLPHVTLARSQQVDAFLPALPGLHGAPALPFVAAQLALISTHGDTYSTVVRWALSDR